MKVEFSLSHYLLADKQNSIFGTFFRFLHCNPPQKSQTFFLPDDIAICRRIVSVYLTILWGWHLKDYSLLTHYTIAKGLNAISSSIQHRSYNSRNLFNPIKHERSCLFY